MICLYMGTGIIMYPIFGKHKNKLDYSYWFNGHYHTDEVHFTNQKPCITLFDRIINIEKVDDFINEKQDIS